MEEISCEPAATILLPADFAAEGEPKARVRNMNKVLAKLDREVCYG